MYSDRRGEATSEQYSFILHTNASHIHKHDMSWKKIISPFTYTYKKSRAHHWDTQYRNIV